MNETIQELDPREMLFRLLGQYRVDARLAISNDLKIPLNYINNWLDGAYPEPPNRKKIKDAYQRFLEGGSPVAPIELSTGTLPATGELEGAEILTLTRFIDHGDDKLWAVATRRFSEEVFVSRTHIDKLREAGAGVGTRFYGKVGPSTKHEGRVQVVALDVIT